MIENHLGMLNKICKFYPDKLFASSCFTLVNELLPKLIKDISEDLKGAISEDIDTMIECIDIQKKSEQGFTTKTLKEVKDSIIGHGNNEFTQEKIDGLIKKVEDVYDIIINPRPELGSSELQYEHKIEEEEAKKKAEIEAEKKAFIESKAFEDSILLLGESNKLLQYMNEMQWDHEMQTYALQLLFWNARKDNSGVGVQVEILRTLRKIGEKAPIVVDQPGIKPYPIFANQSIEALPINAPTSLKILFSKFKEEEKIYKEKNPKLQIDHYYQVLKKEKNLLKNPEKIKSKIKDTKSKFKDKYQFAEYEPVDITKETEKKKVDTKYESMQKDFENLDVELENKVFKKLNESIESDQKRLNRLITEQVQQLELETNKANDPARLREIKSELEAYQSYVADNPKLTQDILSVVGRVKQLLVSSTVESSQENPQPEGSSSFKEKLDSYQKQISSQIPIDNFDSIITDILNSRASEEDPNVKQKSLDVLKSCISKLYEQKKEYSKAIHNNTFKNISELQKIIVDVDSNLKLKVILNRNIEALKNDIKTNQGRFKDLSVKEKKEIINEYFSDNILEKEREEIMGVIQAQEKEKIQKTVITEEKNQEPKTPVANPEPVKLDPHSNHPVSEKIPQISSDETAQPNKKVIEEQFAALQKKDLKSISKEDLAKDIGQLNQLFVNANNEEDLKKELAKQVIRYVKKLIENPITYTVRAPNYTKEIQEEIVPKDYFFYLADAYTKLFEFVQVNDDALKQQISQQLVSIVSDIEKARDTLIEQIKRPIKEFKISESSILNSMEYYYFRSYANEGQVLHDTKKMVLSEINGMIKEKKSTAEKLLNMVKTKNYEKISYVNLDRLKKAFDNHAYDDSIFSKILQKYRLYEKDIIDILEKKKSVVEYIAIINKNQNDQMRKVENSVLSDSAKQVMTSVINLAKKIEYADADDRKKIIEFGKSNSLFQQLVNNLHIALYEKDEGFQQAVAKLKKSIKELEIPLFPSQQSSAVVVSASNLLSASTASSPQTSTPPPPPTPQKSISTVIELGSKSSVTPMTIQPTKPNTLVEKRWESKEQQQGWFFYYITSPISSIWNGVKSIFNWLGSWIPRFGG